MRIPLLHADFERGTFTKIAKALRKLLEPHPLSLMQSQEALALLLGYRNLHDAQKEASAEVPSRFLSLASDYTELRAVHAVVWRLFVHFGMSIVKGRDLVPKLHLDLFSVNVQRTELQRESDRRYREQGIFFDEFGSFAAYAEPWPNQTPALLEAGIPGFEWAITPDRTVFLWHRLVEQIEILPANYLDDLDGARRVPHASDPETAFMVNSLAPAAYLPLNEALAAGHVPLAAGSAQWSIRWLANAGLEPIGRVIVAEKLGALVPRVFDVNGTAIFDALSDLFCGDAVLPDVAPPGTWESNAEVYLFDSFEWKRRSAAHSSGALLMDGNKRLPGSITLVTDGRRFYVQSDHRFREHGQEYMATQLFDLQSQLNVISHEELFRFVQLPEGLDARTADAPAFAAAGSEWYEDVTTALAAQHARNVERFASPETVRGLIEAVDLISASQLNQFVEEQINLDLPLRYPDSTDVDDDLEADRRRTVHHMESLGEEAKRTLPGLERFSSLSLGFVTLYVNGFYPGSRYGYLAQCPQKADHLAQSKFLAGLLAYQGLVKQPMSDGSVALILAMTAVLSRNIRNRSELDSVYFSACRIEAQLKLAGRQLENVAAWRQVEFEAMECRRRGKFMRTGAPIPESRPRSMAETFAEMYTEARSKNTPIFLKKTESP
ncbi:hypothetical protein [Herbaspirillum huttiense]|uniref:hypothetical protein n=1 Tax=Herbaspirillum huttiense TaxID=863372 RepID=UPI0039B0536D